MTFDPHEKHLSARAVEWLRAKTWRILPRYQQPGGLPACWGTMHGPERGLNPPSAIWKKLNKWALKQGLLRWKMHYPMDESGEALRAVEALSKLVDDERRLQRLWEAASEEGAS